MSDNVQAMNMDGRSNSSQSSANLPPASAASGVQANVVLRYAQEITSIACCPPTEVLSEDFEGFRFAFSDLAHTSNYLPIARIQPERIISGRPVAQCCTAFSLSAFDSLENLVRKAKKILVNNPKFLRLVGDHYVKIGVSGSEGVRTSPNATGHFDFFEATSYAGQKSVVRHDRLPL
ncbi:hypothetical protein ACS7SF_10600 [Ralstonia sp. 25C]|uniref:hypothetical protein n=1 Tax=Ralstonia sp. 25C TaxID=3447363 RepID=UPI003F74CD09